MTDLGFNNDIGEYWTRFVNQFELATTAIKRAEKIWSNLPIPGSSELRAIPFHLVLASQKDNLAEAIKHIEKATLCAERAYFDAQDAAFDGLVMYIDSLHDRLGDYTSLLDEFVPNNVENRRMYNEAMYYGIFGDINGDKGAYYQELDRHIVNLHTVYCTFKTAFPHAVNRKRWKIISDRVKYAGLILAFLSAIGGILILLRTFNII